MNGTTVHVGAAIVPWRGALEPDGRGRRSSSETSSAPLIDRVVEAGAPLVYSGVDVDISLVDQLVSV